MIRMDMCADYYLTQNWTKNLRIGRLASDQAGQEDMTMVVLVSKTEIGLGHRLELGMAEWDYHTRAIIFWTGQSNGMANPRPAVELGWDPMLVGTCVQTCVLERKKSHGENNKNKFKSIEIIPNPNEYQ